MITKSQAKRIADINKTFEKLGSDYEIAYESSKSPMSVILYIKVKSNENDIKWKVSIAATRKELNQFLVGVETALTCVSEYATTVKKEDADNENPITIRNENIACGEVTANIVGGCVTMVPISEIHKPDVTDFSGIEPDEEEKI